MAVLVVEELPWPGRARPGKLSRLSLAAAPADQGRADDNGARGDGRDRPAAPGMAATAGRAVLGQVALA